MSWPRKAITEVAAVNPKTPAVLFSDSERLVDFVPMASLSEDGNITPCETRPLADVQKGYTYFENGDVLVAKITPCMENGKAAFVDSLPNAVGFGSTEFHVLRPKTGVSGQYLFWMVWSQQFRAAASINMTGSAGQKRVPANFFERWQIPLPPLPEQKRIAAILDAADALRAKRRESIEQLDSIIQATFLEMFGDPVTNPKGWATSTVGAEVSFMTSGSRGWAKYYASEGDVFIRIQNLRSGRLDLEDVAFVTAPDTAESRRTKVEQGDVLISITADLGRTAVVPPRLGAAFINQHLVLLRFRDMNPFFITQLFETDGGQSQFTRLNRQGVKAGLNFDDIRKLVVLKPPLGLQARFASIVESIEQQKARLKAHLAELDTLFASLQSRAFNGELVA
jgi:type I restriction enzyme S subunit